MPLWPRFWRRSPALPQHRLASARRAASGLAAGGGIRRWRWAGLGALLGGGVCLVNQWPAAWLADALAQASDGRLVLAQAQGTLWQGSALATLSGGRDSRDAMVLPQRLHWQLGAGWDGLTLHLRQAGALPQPLRLHASWSGRSLRLDGVMAAAPLAGAAGASASPDQGAAPGTALLLAQWPAAWLQGLGAPWNTLKLGGQLRLLSAGLEWQRDEQGWQLQGQAELQALGASSSLSPRPLGSYRLRLESPAGQPLQIELSTLDGALQLQGSGQYKAQGGLRFRGEARATPGQEPALNNLLNIIGRRQGAASVFSIG